MSFLYENDEKIFDIFRQFFYYFVVFFSQKSKIFLPKNENSKNYACGAENGRNLIPLFELRRLLLKLLRARKFSASYSFAPL